jgi:hypothetical protein
LIQAYLAATPGGHESLTNPREMTTQIAASIFAVLGIATLFGAGTRFGF